MAKVKSQNDRHMPLSISPAGSYGHTALSPPVESPRSFCDSSARGMIQPVPSPVGHALAGLAVGSLATRDGRWRLPLTCAAAAALPDFDLVLPLAHRGPTHSIVAGLLTAAMVFVAIAATRRSSSPARIAAATGVAVLTHVLLDWLSADRATPRGVMAFWPFDDTYYISDLDLFSVIERRYWREDFISVNATALARELLILVPIAWLARRKHAKGLARRAQS